MTLGDFKIYALRREDIVPFTPCDCCGMDRTDLWPFFRVVSTTCAGSGERGFDIFACNRRTTLMGQIRARQEDNRKILKGLRDEHG